MTIKHQNKNISAEKQYVITDVQDNPNGILTFTLSNLYSNTTDTLQIDLSKHKLTLTKVTQSELNRLKNSQDEIDIKNRESHIYLVQKNTNDEGVYQEFIWVDNDFEIVGSTAINLEPYFLKENIYNGLDYSQNNNTKALSAYQGYLLNQNKINKSDIVTNLTTDNDNKVLSAKQGKLLQDNKLNKNQTSYKGKNVVVDNNSGEITFEDKPIIPEASTTTPLSDSTNGSIGDSNKWAKADHIHPKSNLYAESGHNHDNTYIKLSDIVTNLTTDNDNKVLSAKQGKLLQDNKLNKNQTSYKGKNVVVDNNSGEITFEDKPTIPKAGTIIPFSDSKDGSAGNSDKWAKADHIHRKSNLYAESDHNHDNTYIKLSNTTGLVKNDGTIDTSTYLTKSNFKTIGGNSIVGSGNISLPSKLSDLTNDAGFITSAALNDYVTKDNLSIKYSNEIPTEVDPSEPYSLCIVKSSNGYDVYSIQSTGWVKSATIPSDFAISSHNHNDLYYTKSEVDNMNLGSGSSGEVDLSNYIRKSSTSGLVKNDGSIDTTSYLSSLPSHTHTKSEITDFTHTHSISDITTLQTTLNGKANKSHTHNEYVTDQELYDNIPINYVITATDNTSTESVSPFIVGEDYYFTIMAVQTSSIGVTVMSIPINDIRCEIVHSGAVADLTPVKSDENTVTFKFTPTEQKGHILKVYFLGIPVATYTFDAIIDTGCKEVTFKSGYTRYKDSMSVYIRRKGDVVELTGVWKPTSTKNAASNPVSFASIPDELKPTKSINVICAGVGKNTYRLTVETNGELKWSQYGVTTSNDLTENSFCHVRCTWII